MHGVYSLTSSHWLLLLTLQALHHHHSFNISPLYVNSILFLFNLIINTSLPPSAATVSLTQMILFQMIRCFTELNKNKSWHSLKTVAWQLNELITLLSALSWQGLNPIKPAYHPCRRDGRLS